MSVSEDLLEMDNAELLGLLFQDEGPGSHDPFFTDENIEDWLAEQDVLSAMETEDFLSSLLGLDDDADAASQSHSTLGSDSGISDDSSSANQHPICPSPQSSSDSDPAPSPGPALEPWVFQRDHSYSLPQDNSALQSVRSENPDTDVFIDLDDVESEGVGGDPDLPFTLSMDCSQDRDLFQFKKIVLTDEERRLLTKEGASIPTDMPLTKAEERTLKRVRRKIRNKQSAQESRKKKKVYVDGLENRVAVCTAHNQELQKKVQLLQKQNVSLIEQLRKLQSLMKFSTMKTTTTSTCVMVFLLSFCLIIFPSVNPFSSRAGQKGLYTPSTIVSRTLRSIPVLENGDSSIPDPPEDELLLVAKVEKDMFSGGQNSTPDYQKVEQPESESAVNGNSSSDFPTVGRTELQAGPETPSRDPGVLYEVATETWIDRKPTSVIIQQHRSDEM